jgi:hypothetical protein
MTRKIGRMPFTMCPLYVVALCRRASVDPGIFRSQATALRAAEWTLKGSLLDVDSYCVDGEC